ncbi:sporulation protein YabP [Alkalibaculum sp. M08DMB]|uniref:Sporulation protein YabP n=1 Tax=Alkalibaculum sporogenes TaxID=2655001 RepID=A0A6A7K6B7_9FIRM|nr:sporulation protein YabP [Alkalibaculum sporogenes]MPW24932.1 sporulation protein YabP [Alkalibaculum sporogenes]
MDAKRIEGSGKIELLSREELRLTGVKDVHSFNEEAVILETDLGLLTIGGEDLHIVKLNLEEGELEVKGLINSFVYNDESKLFSKGEGIFSKLFK